MAAKMAAGANTKITFKPVGIKSLVIQLVLDNLVMRFFGVFLEFEVKFKGHIQVKVSEIMQKKAVVIWLLSPRATNTTCSPGSVV